MKFALNGALTIGTLDGSNIEIKAAVGDENIFVFGKTIAEVEALKKAGYRPWDMYRSDEDLRTVLDWLDSDYFNPAPLRNVGACEH